MNTIERHSVDRELAEERYQAATNLLHTSLSVPKQTIPSLRGLFMASRMCAEYLSVLNPGASELRPYICQGARAAAAIALVSAQSSGEVTINLGPDHSVQAKAVGPNNVCHVDLWRSGFYMGLICGDRGSVDVLCALPIDVLRQSSSKGDECLYLFADVLQRFWRHDADVSKRLTAAVEATDPQQLRISPEEFILNIVVPEMELFFRFLNGEVAPFNETLLFALQRHKKYWSKGDRKKDSDGYLALGPLAICGLATPTGIPIEVQSDYIPGSLMRP